MNPANDPLYSIHRCQAQRQGSSPLPYAAFCARLRGQHDQDLSALLPPSAQVQATTSIPHPPKFNPGSLCITPKAASAISLEEVAAALKRHIAGDWGDLCAHDLAENERALRTGGRLFSEYHARDGEKFWIITDAGSEVTNVDLHISDFMLSLQKC